MKKLLVHCLTIAIMVGGPLTLFSCQDDNNPNPSQQAKFAIATIAGEFPAETSYLQALSTLDLETPLNNSSAIELGGTVAVMESFGEHVYVGRFGDPARLFKYSINEDNSLTEEGVIQIDGASTFSGLHIESETEGYCLVFGVDKVIRFTPSDFTVSGEIDLTGLQKSTYTMLKSGMVKRDDQLFIPIEYKDFATFTSPIDSTFVAIVDLTDESAVLIADGRTKDNEANNFPVIIKDEDEDIYVQAKGESGVLPGGILRIRQGEEVFDQSYFFNLNQATATERVVSISHLGGSIAITAAQTAQGNVFFDPVYSYYRLDLDNLEAQRITSIPENKAYTSSYIFQLDDEAAFIPALTQTENALHEYDISEDIATKKLTAVDRIARLVALL